MIYRSRIVAGWSAQAGTLKFRVGPTQKQFGERQDPQKVGQVDSRPVMLDNTIYFLPCQSEAEADFILELVCSRPFPELLNTMVFDGEKRPITAELLKRISLEQVAEQLDRAENTRPSRGKHKWFSFKLRLDPESRERENE